VSGSVPQIRRRPSTPGADTATHIIRRFPSDVTVTSPRQIPAAPPLADDTVAAPPVVIEDAAAPPATTAVAASAVAIVGGWATAVVATELITGWWNSDRLFCLAVVFLAVLSAASTVTGVILLLLRRGVGRWMVVFGAAVALLTFGSVFIAGARLAWPVYVVPLLPLTSLLLAAHPATKRWGEG